MIVIVLSMYDKCTHLSNLQKTCLNKYDLEVHMKATIIITHMIYNNKYIYSKCVITSHSINSQNIIMGK